MVNILPQKTALIATYYVNYLTGGDNINLSAVPSLLASVGPIYFMITPVPTKLRALTPS